MKTIRVSPLCVRWILFASLLVASGCTDLLLPTGSKNAQGNGAGTAASNTPPSLPGADPPMAKEVPYISGSEAQPTSNSPNVGAASPAAPNAPANNPSTAGASSQTGGVQLYLKAGVALPQTGPNGTLMGFSADYYLTGGSLAGSARYSQFFWVIEGSGRQQQLSWPIDRVEEKGNLMLLKDGWRPENGPYRSYIVEQPKDGTRRVVSNVAEMR